MSWWRFSDSTCLLFSALKSQETTQFLLEISGEMEKVSVLYMKHERKLCRFFCALESKVDAAFHKIEVCHPAPPTAILVPTPSLVPCAVGWLERRNPGRRQQSKTPLKRLVPQPGVEAPAGWGAAAPLGHPRGPGNPAGGGGLHGVPGAH